MNKLLFLDFDGVLHPSHFAGQDPFNRVHLLEEVVEGSNICIVISSSWRFTHSLERLRKLLPNSISSLVIGVTGSPVIGKHPRYQEIMNHTKGLEPGTSWRALDDSYWEFPANCQELIRCNPNTGVGPKEVAQLRTWLTM